MAQKAKTDRWYNKLHAFRTLAAVCVCASGWFGAVQAAENQPAPMMFLAADMSAAETRQENDHRYPRARLAKINWDSLLPVAASSGGATAATSVVALNLFDTEQLHAVPTRREIRSPTSFTWLGYVEGVDASQVTLVVEDGVMAGNIAIGQKFYQVRHRAAENYIIREVDRARFPREGEPIPTHAPKIAAERAPGAVADTGAIIDLMVVYTPGARIEEGGSAAINALIVLAITETNMALSRSNVTARVRLAHKAEVNYIESGDFYTDLSSLEEPGDGVMDQVHSWRNAYGADQVTLVAADNDTLCGLANLMTDLSQGFEQYAFSVVSRSCATGPLYTFGHELGHNMGIQHDRLDEPADGIFPHSHGYVNNTVGFRTMLGVQGSCSHFSGCPRILNYSNPNVFSNGIPTGIPQSSPQSADAAASINAAAFTIANWRTQVLRSVAVDYDGDGKSDISVYRNGLWVYKPSSSGANVGIYFGGGTDVPLSKDYDGDGRTDIAVYRSGLWIYQPSLGGAPVAVPFGGGSDVPVPGDYDGDGKADIAVYRDGQWLIRRSFDTTIITTQFGGGTDVPVPADYDGDGKADIAVYRNGLWIYQPSSGGANVAVQFGGGTDVPVEADYDGDGRTDIAVYRNGLWIYQPSSGGAPIAIQFGGGTDIPVPADYDGDGKTDIAVYRDGLWIYKPSLGGSNIAIQFGGGTDVPLN